MDNGREMGRRQFFSRFFPVMTESIAEKTKDEIKIATNSSVTKETANLDKAEAADSVEETSERKYPWVGM
ncbi:hypothetical protein [Candidatus Nitrotoga sp. M5]|uniref:hypothetical protein n=1 Tax=Candidatus Nitrotoga sp. M5 TaxID=2890409 RepID=UPI001EF2B37C|nr:hypothetical protein [Candidatus Nitrotoga sp. M5]CAH1386975.1 conserved hypothetical protein [Candidatus Nitrotoga sp. M5]